MNIFFLDRNPRVAAAYHCDKHVVKMVTESAQLLSAACRLCGSTDDRLYKLTHKNHPSAIWTRSSVRHYAYVLELFGWLSYEYSLRYHKTHKCDSMLDMFVDHLNILPIDDWIDPPQCMPDDCKSDNVVESYRQYYKKHKSHFATWKTNTPEWYK